jgi:hypothetical protein
VTLNEIKQQVLDAAIAGIERCGLPAPPCAYRSHGLPAPCCEPDDTLVVWADSVRTHSAQNDGPFISPCGGDRRIEVFLRFAHCRTEAIGDGVIIEPDGAEADSDYMDSYFDAVFCGLQHVTTDETSPLACEAITLPSARVARGKCLTFTVQLSIIATCECCN